MSGIDKPPTEPVIKNLTDGRYELHCPVCGESVIPPLPCPIECVLSATSSGLKPRISTTAGKRP
jgi:hypothetical protein